MSIDPRREERPTKLIIPALPPSANKFIGRNARWAYQAAKEEWHWRVKAALRERPREPYKKAVVKITYYFPDRRRRDPDNYAPKLLLDPLVREGIIADDSFWAIDLTLRAEVDRENPRTEIEIIEIDMDNQNKLTIDN